MTDRNRVSISAYDSVRFPSSIKSLSSEIATRKRSVDFFALGMYLPNPDPVLKKLGKSISVYRELATDAHVRGNIKSRKAGVTKLLWDLDRGKTKNQIANLIEDIFKNRLNVHQIISEITDAPLYGYAPLEIIWESVGGRWLPARVVGKPQHWFNFDENNQLRFITHDNLSGEIVPDKKFIVATQEATYDNPYGFPDLSCCFWPLTFKKGGLKFWVTFTEKFGMPQLIGKHPGGATDAQKMEMLDMLERMVQDGLAVIPENASIETLDIKGGTSSADIYKLMIDTCNNEISKALLGQTLTTEIGSTGSQAAAKTHNQVREDIIAADKLIVCSAMQQLINLVVELNFGATAHRPRFSLYKKGDVDLTLSMRDKNLTAGGRVRLSKKYYQRAYGFREDEIELASEE